MNIHITETATSFISLLWALAFVGALAALIFSIWSKGARGSARKLFEALNKNAADKYDVELEALALSGDEAHGKKRVFVLPSLSKGETSWVMSARTREHALYQKRERSTGR